MPRIFHLKVYSIAALLLILNPANAQGLLGKERPEVAAMLEQIAGTEGDGVRSGSCLRPIGDIGTEEFSVYLLLPNSKIEGFIVELAGDDGAATEIAANAGIVSFNEAGGAVIRDNNGLAWIAEVYAMAANFIRTREMYEDESYAEALQRVPTERCPMPRWGGDVRQFR
jgi:hypothetical protein